MARRGADIPRPKPWTVKGADRQAALGWDLFVSPALEAADRAWVAMTSDPRRTADRQHQLRGSLGQVMVGGKKLDQWQVEPTAGGRVAPACSVADLPHCSWAQSRLGATAPGSTKLGEGPKWLL